MRTIAEHIARASREARDLVLVTIMESKGSTPRHAGSQMLVDENGLACGTIGGGAVEAGEIDQPPFLLNTRNRTLEKNGQRIKLTQVEYAIMKMFMENPGKALSREEILDMVWGHDYFGELKIVDVNIRRLRLKIEDNATNPTYITTIWGFGYKWGL